MDPKWTQNGPPKMEPKWSQNGPKMDPKWTRNGPEMDPKWTRNGPEMDPKWTQNGPKMDPKWTQNGPKMDTELDTHINAFGAWHTYKRGSPQHFQLKSWLVQFFLYKIQNHLSQWHIGVRFDRCIFEIVVPIPNSWDDRDPLTTLNEQYKRLLFLVSAITSLLFLIFVSGHAGIFSNFSHYFSTAAFASGGYIVWGTGIKLFFLAMWSSCFFCFETLFVGLYNTSIFRLVLSNCATGLFVFAKLKSTKHRCWHWNFQLSMNIFIFRLDSLSLG